MIVIDENVEQHWIELLRQKGYKLLLISQVAPRSSDSQVIEIAKQHKGILLTEDKDFGELVFSHNIQSLSIFFLRYDQPQYAQIETALLKTIEEFLTLEEHYFVTITMNNIRIRKL